MGRCSSFRTSWAGIRTTSPNSSASTPNSATRSKPPRANSIRKCVAAPSPPLSTSTPPAKAAVIESANAMQEQAVGWLHAGYELGVVPTTGALHRGHHSLVALAPPANLPVIVPALVNPPQLGP